MTAAPLVIGMVAGEASGDQLGAHLMRALRAHLPQARFTGIGGPRMEAEGMRSLFPLEKLAVRGYVEVLRHYLEILAIRRALAAHFRREPPALFIGVDAPDFNLKLELELRRAGVPTAHYVGPQIWAWRAQRIRLIRRAVEKMLVVFPFEQALYERAGVPVAYVGHPLADLLARVPRRAAAREQLRVAPGARVVALLPGSRVSELEHMADLFVRSAALVAQAAGEVHFLVPCVSRATRELFEAALARGAPPPRVTLLFGHAHEAMSAADVVLAAAGTATLEAALLGRAMVVTYRMPRATWWIMNHRRYQPYAALPNILAGEYLVPEFLQDEATPENLAQAVVNLLEDDAVRARLEARFAAMAQELRCDSAQRAVEALLPLLGSRGVR